MKTFLAAIVVVPLAASLAAQSTGVIPDEFTLQRMVELISSAGIVGVLTLWLMDMRRQLEAQRATFQRELEAERIAHETTRRMLIDMLKEQRPVYGHYDSKLVDRVNTHRTSGILEGD